MLTVFTNHYLEFYKFGDVSILVPGAISIIDGNWGHYPLGVKLMLFNIGSVDGAAHAATVKEGFGQKVLGSSAGA